MASLAESTVRPHRVNVHDEAQVAKGRQGYVGRLPRSLQWEVSGRGSSEGIAADTQVQVLALCQVLSFTKKLPVSPLVANRHAYISHDGFLPTVLTLA